MINYIILFFLSVEKFSIFFLKENIEIFQEYLLSLSKQKFQKLINRFDKHVSKIAQGIMVLQPCYIHQKAQKIVRNSVNPKNHNIHVVIQH
jgi:hypothetical protein